MDYVGHHDAKSPDRNGINRTVIVFELALINNNVGTYVHEANLDEKIDVNKLYNRSLKELREIAISKTNQRATHQQHKVNVYNRSNSVRVYVLRRANGICEGCSLPAPFVNKQGYPFLETHHIQRLTDGGPDHPRFVAALCPNCHRRAHYARDRATFNRQLARIVGEKERGKTNNRG